MYRMRASSEFKRTALLGNDGTMYIISFVKRYKKYYTDVEQLIL